MKFTLLLLLPLFIQTGDQNARTIRFKAADGLEMGADLYMPHPASAPLIILFHQAHWSRGEYIEIAPKLNELGFNCLVPDLRAGGSINDIENITRQNALKKLAGTSYIDALQDMIGAINYAHSRLATGKVIIWGSSYSAALALKLAGDLQERVDAVIAFSPGEYFSSLGKPRDYIKSSAMNISQPVFISSARDEKNNWWGIYVAIPSANKNYFVPETLGNHGSRALWKQFPDSPDYWRALKEFLTSI